MPSLLLLFVAALYIQKIVYCVSLAILLVLFLFSPVCLVNNVLFCFRHMSLESISDVKCFKEKKFVYIFCCFLSVQFFIGLKLEIQRKEF